MHTRNESHAATFRAPFNTSPGHTSLHAIPMPELSVVSPCILPSNTYPWSTIAIFITKRKVGSCLTLRAPSYISLLVPMSLVCIRYCSNLLNGTTTIDPQQTQTGLWRTRTSFPPQPTHELPRSVSYSLAFSCDNKNNPNHLYRVISIPLDFLPRTRR